MPRFLWSWVTGTQHGVCPPLLGHSQQTEATTADWGNVQNGLHKAGQSAGVANLWMPWGNTNSFAWRKMKMTVSSFVRQHTAPEKALSEVMVAPYPVRNPLRFRFLRLVNLIRGVVKGEGFVRPAQAFVFLECFCDVTPHCLHFMKLLELHFSKATRQCSGRKVWIPGYLRQHRQGGFRGFWKPSWNLLPRIWTEAYSRTETVLAG